MVSDDLPKQLHNRATRGESLSAEEQAHLEDWYAGQDSTESQELGLTVTERQLATLRAQVDATLTQLMTVTKRIQETAVENETLRAEIATLRRQLARQLGPQPI